MKATKQTQVAVTEAVKHNESGQKKWTVLRDLLKADGIVSKMLRGADRDKELVESLKPAVTLGFSVAERKALAGDVKAMSQEQKDFRKVTQQKIGAYIGYIANELAKLEKAEAAESCEGEDGESEEKTEDKPKTVADKLKVVFETAAKLVQGDEAPEGYDPVALAKLINQALKTIK
jgi:hypothetical protein